MESATPKELYELAKRTLGLHPGASNSAISPAYLDELKKHKQISQHDLHFRLSAQPGWGYGTIKCLEKGCEGEVIPLGRGKTADGGKSEGIGSLAAYRYHIGEHPTHSKSRYTRIKAEHAAKINRPTGATPLSNSGSRLTQIGRLQPGNGLTASPGSQSSSRSGSANGSPAYMNRPSSVVRIKAEPTEQHLSPMHSGTNSSSTYTGAGSKPRVSSVQRINTDTAPELSLKRLSDSMLSPRLPSEMANNEYPAKRIKSDTYAIGPPKTPLSPVNRDTGLPSTALVPPPMAYTPPVNNTVDVEDIRWRMADVQRSISSLEPAYNRLSAKRNPTKADTTRLNNYSASLTRLRNEKDELNAQIPVAYPYQSPNYTNHLSTVTPPAPGPFEAPYQDPTMPGAFPLVDYDPYQMGATQQPYVTAAGFPAILKTEPTQTTLDAHFRPEYDQQDNQLYNRTPNQDQEQPVASGSNAPQILARGKFPDLDSDSDNEDPHAFMNRIIPNIPIVAPLANAGNFDENGDFFGRGRDTFQGPVAKADDIEKFLIEAGNAESFDGNEKVETALAKLGLKSLASLLPGMEIALMPHQVIGVAWMISKEQSPHKGGCLGDDMGLGKTVQMIATMLKNPSDDPGCKTSLILTPTALLDQWKMEIEMKTNCDLKVLIYHGSSKPRRKSDILKYDVVLTTYTTMALEWPDFEGEQKKLEKARQKKKKQQQQGFIVHDSDSEDFKPKKKKESGLLFQIDFYRIILDEAQYIRNRRTRASRAITELRATYRWCLTGTPIINALADCYPYFRFLQIRPWYDFSEFQGHIGSYEKKNPTIAISRLQAVLSTMLLRRMKDSELDGKRLIELPEKTVNLVRLEFSEEEREVYDMVERGAQATFNRYLRAGTVLKNYSQVLVLLLRLRQICSHPSLIQENAAAFISPDEVYEDTKPKMTTEIIRARRVVGPEFVLKLMQKYKEAALQRMKAEKASADAVAEGEECPICFDELTDAVVTACTHSFCRECIMDVINRPPQVNVGEDLMIKANEHPCPSCRGPICADKLFNREAFLPTEADLNSEESDVEMEDVGSSMKRLRRSGRPGKAVARRNRRSEANSFDVLTSETESGDDDDEDDDLSDFIVQDGEDEEEKDARRALKKRLGKKRANIVPDSDDEVEETPEEKEVYFGKKVYKSPEEIKILPRFLPSTKMKHMMLQLEKMMHERPDEKVLVISQWTSCLDLVSDYLSEAGVIHVKYQGDMTRPKREQAVRAFMSKGKAKVMLMSMKCGGVGLNLTRANNVLSLDLGWSQAIENQSFDRVHRLGQNRPVLVERLVISNTVEDRVLAMQERKKILSDGSLGEGSAKKMGRLSVRELAGLFGLDHLGRRIEERRDD